MTVALLSSATIKIVPIVMPQSTAPASGTPFRSTCGCAKLFAERPETREAIHAGHRRRGKATKNAIDGRTRVTDCVILGTSR